MDIRYAAISALSRMANQDYKKSLEVRLKNNKAHV